MSKTMCRFVFLVSWLLFSLHSWHFETLLHVSASHSRCLWPNFREEAESGSGPTCSSGDQTFGFVFDLLLPTHYNQLGPNFQSHMSELTRLPRVAGSVLRGENVSIVRIIVLFKCMNKCAAAGASLSFIRRTFQVFDRGADAICVYSQTTACSESEVINISHRWKR